MENRIITKDQFNRLRGGVHRLHSAYEAKRIINEQLVIFGIAGTPGKMQFTVDDAFQRDFEDEESRSAIRCWLLSEIHAAGFTDAYIDSKNCINISL